MPETSRGVGADVAFPALARELAYCSLQKSFYAEIGDSSKTQAKHSVRSNLVAIDAIQNPMCDRVWGWLVRMVTQR
jgi:hypothetical protein